MDRGDDAVLLKDADVLPSGARYDVFIRRADDAETFPSGFKYRLYYGFTGDPPALLYDNGHRKGEHHRHVEGDLDPDYEFPGIEALWRQFREEIETYEQSYPL